MVSARVAIGVMRSSPRQAPRSQGLLGTLSPSPSAAALRALSLKYVNKPLEKGTKVGRLHCEAIREAQMTQSAGFQCELRTCSHLEGDPS